MHFKFENRRADKRPSFSSLSSIERGASLGAEVWAYMRRALFGLKYYPHLTSPLACAFSSKLAPPSVMTLSNGSFASASFRGVLSQPLESGPGIYGTWDRGVTSVFSLLLARRRFTIYLVTNLVPPLLASATRHSSPLLNATEVVDEVCGNPQEDSPSESRN
jgi:hypothetical protein